MCLLFAIGTHTWIMRVWDSSKRKLLQWACTDHVKGYRKKENKTNKRSIEGKLFGYIFTVLTLKFALDSTLESVKKISSMGWEMDSFLDCFSISFLTKEMVPKSNISRSKSKNYKRCFHRNKTIFSRWSKLEWRLQVEEAWKIVAWLTCLSSFLQPDKKN